VHSLRDDVTQVRYPSRLTLLRGWLDSADCAKVRGARESGGGLQAVTVHAQAYGVYDEVLALYDGVVDAWVYLTEAFDYLPLSALVDGKVRGPAMSGRQ
jgi:serine/threonine-protein phosphatase 2A catalytic subunit